MFFVEIAIPKRIGNSYLTFYGFAEKDSLGRLFLINHETEYPILHNFGEVQKVMKLIEERKERMRVEDLEYYRRIKAELKKIDNAS